MSEEETPTARRPRRSGRQIQVEVEGDKDDEQSWLMVYLDVITLLLIVFVVLLVLLDPADDTSPGDPGLFDGQPHILDGQPAVLDGMPRPGEEAFDLPPELEELGIQATGEEETLTFRLDDSVLFEVGRAVLQPAGRAAIDELVPIFEATGARISVEGHTDNVPISSAQFPSNWELSSARASSVLRYLVDQGLDQRRLRAIGYGEIRPLADNDTPEGRAENRRVEITLHLDPRRQDISDLPLPQPR